MRLDGIMGNILNMKLAKFGKDGRHISCSKLKIKKWQIPAIFGNPKNIILNFNHLIDILNIGSILMRHCGITGNTCILNLKLAEFA